MQLIFYSKSIKNCTDISEDNVCDIVSMIISVSFKNAHIIDRTL